jgi:selenocysteine lyase/cysteine desulfurase
MKGYLPANIRQKVRRQFPALEKTIYLNTASVGPWPKVTKEAMQKNIADWDKLIDTTPEVFDNWREIKPTIAEMINAQVEEIGFAYNTSYGLNIAAAGIDFKAGDEIILSDVEFPANTYVWTKLETQGVKVKFIKSRDMCFDIDVFKKAITTKTKLFSISFVQFFNGFRNDLAKLGKICHEQNIFFAVDGIQGVANIPLDVKKCKIDLLACGGYKWLMSPVGCGFFYLNKKAKLRIEPVQSGWFGVDWKGDVSYLLRHHLKPMKHADRFGMTLYPFLQMMGLHASVKLIKSIGVDRIYAHNQFLINEIMEYLDGHQYYRLATSSEPKHRSSILAISCADPQSLQAWLKKRKIITSYREGMIRVAVNFYNTAEHVTKFLKALDLFYQASVRKTR